ncbi:MAG TPA: hypothetical protein VMR73_00940, partial [Candidatus Paceibacterota bacterium]|nr:hypothetical protein [Candidatus Paceibacterota bacterium]
MKQKTFIFILLAVVLVAVFAGWYFFFRISSSSTSGNPTTTINQNLFPYGSVNPNTGSTTTTTNQTGSTTINETPGQLPQLIQITNTPVSGAIFLPETKNASSTVVRYIDRATGHIYDFSIETETKTEVANTTIPKVYQGYFSPNGSRAILQSLDDNNDIQTVSANIPTNATSTFFASSTNLNLTDVRFLPKNITSLSIGNKSLF